MKSIFGKGANWRITRLSGISPFLSVALLVIAVPSHASIDCIPTDMNSRYHAAYKKIVGKIEKAPNSFWRNVSKMGDQEADFGLGIWNSGTEGEGIISEATSYAMILAALYDDRGTFERLSATVQAGINYNQSKGNPRLFPWWWTPTPNAKTANEYSPANPPAKPNVGFDSASDADINIALAYIYADMAVNNCEWANPTPSYKAMASDYIKAIRGPSMPSKSGYYGDFSNNDTNTANNSVLADGYTQAKDGFSKTNWHPDYSDIRAYTAGATFWDTAISTTISSWKAILNFTYNPTKLTPIISDPREIENPKTGQINPTPPSTSWVRLSNPVYQMLQANSDYLQVTAVRNDPNNPGDNQFYTSDSQRLPIRLLNYLNATKNNDTKNSGNAAMFGVASANLTALGTSYCKAGFKALTDRVSIVNPYPSKNPVFIQNFNAAGLLAYASNDTLVYDNSVCDSFMVNGQKKTVNRDAIHMDLLGKFADGTNGAISLELDKSDGFNALLSLWGLTVSIDGQTPLQKYILSK